MKGREVDVEGGGGGWLVTALSGEECKDDGAGEEAGEFLLSACTPVCVG